MGGCLLPGGIPTCTEADPPWEQTPGSRHPPPPLSACWEIRSTRGRYASYWNAILYLRATKPQASVFVVSRWTDGSPDITCPRYVARRQLERLEKQGYCIMSGIEMEFRLFDMKMVFWTSTHSHYRKICLDN